MKLAEFIRLRAFEDPFTLANERWQFVTVKRADGCHEYADFRALFNLA
jgi:hypothetical protein